MEVPIAHRDTKPSNTTEEAKHGATGNAPARGTASATTTAPETTAPLGKRRCSRCRLPGHRADRCTAGAQPMRPADDEKDERRAAIAKVARKRAGALPKPTSSFDVDHETGEVRELDFGGSDSE